MPSDAGYNASEPGSSGTTIRTWDLGIMSPPESPGYPIPLHTPVLGVLFSSMTGLFLKLPVTHLGTTTATAKTRALRAPIAIHPLSPRPSLVASLLAPTSTVLAALSGRSAFAPHVGAAYRSAPLRGAPLFPHRDRNP